MTTEQIEAIITELELGQEYFIWKMEQQDSESSEDEKLEGFYENIILSEHINHEDDEKVLALMENTGDNWDDCENTTNYKVYTDAEADELVDSRMDTYLADNILYEIPDHLHQYFDADSWKSDNEDDRGNWLNSVDGTEYEEEINGTIYYIYKV